ncbi:MAG: MoaD/ThiS family protein [Anaerolineae bacterium]|nr:MoaD/ThiS family protein [Anaerolineae bacterium]MEB2288809.1 MoaD/ThiS family protein [Anaerolineae bacterium]
MSTAPHHPTVTVRFSASLRAAAGTKEMAVPCAPDTTVRALLHAISAGNPALADRLLDSQQDLSQGTQVLINGRHIDFLGGLETPIQPTDSVMLIPPVGGG